MKQLHVSYCRYSCWQVSNLISDYRSTVVNPNKVNNIELTRLQQSFKMNKIKILPIKLNFPDKQLTSFLDWFKTKPQARAGTNKINSSISSNLIIILCISSDAQITQLSCFTTNLILQRRDSYLFRNIIYTVFWWTRYNFRKFEQIKNVIWRISAAQENVAVQSPAWHR